MIEINSWINKSSVKSHEYRYTLQINSMKDLKNKTWINEEWYRFFISDEIVRNLNVEEKNLLGACIMSNFMAYTVEVEHTIVTPIVEKISHGESTFFSGRETRLACYGVLSDEVYHAMFSYDIFETLVSGGDMAAINDFEQDSKNKASDLLSLNNENLNDREHEISMLALGVFSEVCISTQLTKISRNTILEPIYYSLKDHLDDEKRHAAIFILLMRDFWHSSSESEKVKFVKVIVKVIEMKVSYMDRAWVNNFLVYINKDELIDKYLNEKRTDKYQDISNFVEKTAKILFRELGSLGAWKVDKIWNIIQKYHLEERCTEAKI